MEEWKECKLKDICDYGKDRIEVSTLDNSTYISTENMLPNRAGITTATTLPTGEYTPNFEIDDTLVSNIRPYFKKIWKATFSGGCSADVLVFKAKENISKDYLYYVLADDEFFKYSMATSKGTKMPRGDKTPIMNYPVKLPPLPTQQKIAAILSCLDDKIELNNKINTNLEHQAQAIYTNICLNAETQKLENLISFIETGTRPKGGAELSGIPSIGAEKIEGIGKYDYSNEKYISQEFFSKMKRGIVLSKDVLLYKDGAYTGKSSMALNGFPHKECAVNEHVFILRTQDNYAQFFLYCTLKNPDIHKAIYNLACGKAAQPGLNQQELLSVTIPFPSKDNILKFEDTVAPLMNKIVENALESRNLAIVRDTLLPKLINGEIETNSNIISKE